MQLFLETSEDEYAHEVARAHNEQGSGAKKTLASTLQLFKDLSHSTANLMSGKHDDEEEDPDYIKVRVYHWPGSSSASDTDHVSPFASYDW